MRYDDGNFSPHQLGIFNKLSWRWAWSFNLILVELVSRVSRLDCLENAAEASTVIGSYGTTWSNGFVLVMSMTKDVKDQQSRVLT